MVETHSRSVVKAISWRIVATLTTVLLVFVFTRDFVISLGVGSLEFLLKILVYYLHERVWNMIQYGRR
jgi:adenylylsulfate kinase